MAKKSDSVEKAKKVVRRGESQAKRKATVGTAAIAKGKVARKEGQKGGSAANPYSLVDVKKAKRRRQGEAKLGTVVKAPAAKEKRAGKEGKVIAWAVMPGTHFSPRRARGPAHEVRFGSVVVVSASPSNASEKRNIAEGRAALNRARNVLLRPGVEVVVEKDVPLYHADPDSPGLLVRTLQGRMTKGRLVGGKFKPVTA